jgi:hypothetical protein
MSHILVRTGYRTTRQKQLSMLPHLQHFTEVRGKTDQHSTSRICSANTRGVGDRDASMVDGIDSLSKSFRPQISLAVHLIPKPGVTSSCSFFASDLRRHKLHPINDDVTVGICI